jgi:hypothetical protein
MPMASRSLAVFSFVGLFAACASSTKSQDLADATPQPSQEPARQGDVAPPAASASAAASPPVAEKKPSKSDTLAEKLLAGAIGWNDKEGAFVVVTRYSEEGSGESTMIKVTPNKLDQKADTLCSPGLADCSNTAAAAKKAAAFLDAHKLEDTTLLEAVELKPEGEPAGELTSLKAKLVWKKDHLDLTRDKKTTSLRKIGDMKDFKLTATKAAASPDGKMLIVLVAYDPGSKYGKGLNQGFDAYTYPVP